jgi:8-oxo-dGTP pyrophosphatase MutT (NUDIX family)
MAMPTERRKVLAYITSGTSLLVFRHPDFPDAGIQVPAGTVEDGEDPDTAVLREAAEETGLNGLQVDALLGEQVRDMADVGRDEVHHRYVYHLRCDDSVPATWHHTEQDPSDDAHDAHDAPIVFEFSWVSLPDGVPPLITDHGALLPALWQRLASDRRGEDRRATSWLDSRIEVRASTIEGRGLFATAHIAAGEAMASWGGEFLPAVELEMLKQRPKYSSAFVDDTTIIVFDDGDPVTLGNHSCDPSTWMQDSVSTSARRDIEPGEEITIDYATHTDNPTWSMVCRCGSSLCREIIRGDDWQLSELQRRYAGHFSPFIGARIDHRKQ